MNQSPALIPEERTSNLVSPRGAEFKSYRGAAPAAERPYATPPSPPAAAPHSGSQPLGPLAARRVARPGFVNRLAPRRDEPAPNANSESYSHNADNPFRSVGNEPLSTFSVDVDTASYSNARRFITGSQLPPADAIRTEEWINYFAYDYPAPRGDAPFSVSSEVSSCPWSEGHKLARIGLRGRSIADEHVPARNLVFLIDVSGSMAPANRLPLLTSGLAMLARSLRPEDSIAMVVYAGSSGVVLPATEGTGNRAAALEALQRLEAGGSTNGGDGIRLAYSIAQEHFKKKGINRVILATDGDFNVGTTSEQDLVDLIEEKRRSGVFLTVLGFGEGNLKDSTMEHLADKGNGNYAYIDSLYEAKKVLVREAGATLVTIAKDVKLQVEFNPKRVAAYRLIGYENRVLANRDFNDDLKDAGEIGAGHTVTALYEIVPSGASSSSVDGIALKYQQTGRPAAAAGAELFTVSIRYKPPQGDTSTKISEVVMDSTVPFAQASNDHRFVMAVAEAAQVLRSAPDFAHASLVEARSIAADALGGDLSGDRREFVALLDRAGELGGPR
jgi:Ca-activated chloride channel family protein